jgi:hypothetical protein
LQDSQVQIQRLHGGNAEFGKEGSFQVKNKKGTIRQENFVVLNSTGKEYGRGILNNAKLDGDSKSDPARLYNDHDQYPTLQTQSRHYYYYHHTHISEGVSFLFSRWTFPDVILCMDFFFVTSAGRVSAKFGNHDSSSSTLFDHEPCPCRRDWGS